MFKILNIILVCTITFVNVVFCSEESVQAIAVVFRHGDRSPAFEYPNDPYQNCHWRGGVGALSEIGTVQQYINGKRLRRRYEHLIPENGLYSTEVMSIRSSAVERCLMSAESFMAGFLPPRKQRNVLPIPWQPVPVPSVPTDIDDLIAQMKPCPKYDSTLHAVSLDNPAVKKIIKNKPPNFFEELSKNSGLNITNLGTVFMLFDTLKIEKDADLKLPKWAEDNFETLKKLAELQFESFSQAYVVKYIKGAHLLNDIVTNFDIFTRNLTKNIFVYSGHDTTLVTLMSTLEILEQTSVLPEYAATLVLELHSSVALDGDYEIKMVYFRNSYVQTPIEIEIPKCKAPCPFQRFVKNMSKRLVQNYNEACGIETD